MSISAQRCSFGPERLQLFVPRLLSMDADGPRARRRPVAPGRQHPIPELRLLAPRLPLQLMVDLTNTRRVDFMDI